MLCKNVMKNFCEMVLNMRCPLFILVIMCGNIKKGSVLIIKTACIFYIILLLGLHYRNSLAVKKSVSCCPGKDHYIGLLHKRKPNSVNAIHMLTCIHACVLG